MGNFEQVVDVGFGGGSLASLGGVLLGGETGSLQDGLDGFQLGGGFRVAAGSGMAYQDNTSVRRTTEFR